MKKQLNTAIAALFLTTASMATMATEVGDAYVTAGVWNLKADLGNTLSGSGITVDDEDTVGSITVGYQVDKNLSVEGGVIGSGEVSVNYTGSGSGTYLGKAYSYSVDGAVKAETDTSYTLGLKYSNPVNEQVDIYGKAGMLFWDVDYSVTGAGTFTYNGTGYTLAGASKFAEASGNDLYVGVGASYTMTKDTKISAEYMKSEVHGADVDGLSAAITFDF